ncbi:MAG TPA: mechanosensitive ion channel family protein [Cyclobacteriaceae bacterium]|nr:mechanosensitive ion channel family protein [Cyclobacteriaceae bacterium]
MEIHILDRVYMNNTVQDYLVAVGIFVVLLTVLRVFRNIVLKRLKKIAEQTETTFDDFLIDAAEKAIMPLLNYGAFYFAATHLVLSARAEKVLYNVSVVLLVFFAIRLILATIRHALEVQILKGDNGQAKLGQLKGMMVIISAVIWVLGLVFLLDNWGYDITAIVTGLGIGGIAIALAAQNILGDLFNYFVIFFDRPFEVGDFIVVDEKRGTVEQIGIKTTRIRSFTGEELIFSNSYLSGSRIHNFKRMEKRRASFMIGVTYQTPAEKLKEIPGIIKEIIDVQEDATFDRSHFHMFGDFSLNFETVYFVTGTDYAKYMNIQQAINLRIFEEFEKRGIEFAYPTQTLFLEKSEVKA